MTAYCCLWLSIWQCMCALSSCTSRQLGIANYITVDVPSGLGDLTPLPGQKPVAYIFGHLKLIAVIGGAIMLAAMLLVVLLSTIECSSNRKHSARVMNATDDDIPIGKGAGQQLCVPHHMRARSVQAPITSCVAWTLAVCYHCTFQQCMCCY